MNGITSATSTGSTVSSGAILNRLFVIAYVTAVAVAMFGWVSLLVDHRQISEVVADLTQILR